MKVKILRQMTPATEPYWETFIYDGSADNTVAGVLDDLNYRDDIKDIHGNAVGRIGWECSCLQGVCGSCAMVINGTPALACETFLRDMKCGTIVIEPLKKFQTICDLVVDRSVIEECFRKGQVYVDRDPDQADAEHDQREYEHQYIAARCLKCGLCLEVCPNYAQGVNFYGAAFANDCYLCDTLSGQESKRIKETYREHFADGCSKAMSCMKVCPMQIPTISSMAKMNR